LISGWISRDGSGAHPAASGRYHLYAAAACPWSHRAILVRVLRGLQDAISVAHLDPYRDDRGWALTGGEFTDDVNGFEFLADAYHASDARYAGRISSPVLWDRQVQEIVSNESSEIMRMFNDDFADFGDPRVNLCPDHLRPEINRVNSWLQESLNTAVYDAGWATSQEAYDAAYAKVFSTLDELDRQLAGRRFLFGEAVTESDVRVFTTLVRFDTVYHQLYRCNASRLMDYPNLWGYARDIYQLPGIAATVSHDQIKAHYYRTQLDLNPLGIIPRGPRILPFDAPHDRHLLTGALARQQAS
jgi:glutathionyl-hydroquinone reductase